MAGYKGYSMSNNAVEAYAEGEKPLSIPSMQTFKKPPNCSMAGITMNAMNTRVKKSIPKRSERRKNGSGQCR
jgi:hypothetical protein